VEVVRDISDVEMIYNAARL